MIFIVILINLLIISVLSLIWLAKRGLDQQDTIKDIQAENVAYQENISGKMIEFREHLATMIGSGFYDDDENLNLLMKHANYMIEFLEGLDRGIKMEFLDDALKGSEVRTVAHFSSAPHQEETYEEEEIGQE